MPLIDRETTVGVLQLLDKRDSPSFTLRDMELLEVFAAQAGAAIAASRLHREVPLLLAASLGQLTDGELDAALWNALASVTSFPTHDLFSTFR